MKANKFEKNQPSEEETSIKIKINYKIEMLLCSLELSL